MLAVTCTRRAPCARAQSFGAGRSDLSRPCVALGAQVIRQAPGVTPEPAQTFWDVCCGCPAGARAPDPGEPHTPGNGPQHASRAHAGSSAARCVQCCQHGSMNGVPGCTLACEKAHVHALSLHLRPQHHALSLPSPTAPSPLTVPAPSLFLSAARRRHPCC